MSSSVDTKYPQGQISGSEPTRIHDEVVSWVKKVQISVGKAGDQILEDIRCRSQAGTQGTKFIGNEEFLQTITPDKIGFLQDPDNKFSIEDYSLDLTTPVTNLKPNAEVKCKIVNTKPGIEIPPPKVSLFKDGKAVCQIPQSDLPLFIVPVPVPGDYEVHAMMLGRHLRGSPLCLPVFSESVIKDRLAKLGLAPLDSKVFSIGTKCFAKWSEDSTWYNAVVEKIVDTKYHVTFTDYGNGDELEEKDLRLSVEDIPPNEEVDENIPLPSNTETVKDKSCQDVEIAADKQKTFTIGENVRAKWSEDETWYNAKVLSVSGTKIGVNFVDYGNDAEESIGRILPIDSQLPDGDLIDELVNDTATTPDKNQKPEIVQPSISKPPESDQPPLTKMPSNEPRASNGNVLDIKVDDLVIGKWADDNVWYNAKVLKINDESANVLFVDYGNEEELKLTQIVRTSIEIPDKEAIDEFVNNNISSPKPDSKKGDTHSPKPTGANIDDAKEVNAIVCKFEVGDQVIAQWSEDGVWYNAKIVQILAEHAEVLFLDYGNDASVNLGKIVRTVEEIPDPRDIDENVTETENAASKSLDAESQLPVTLPDTKAVSSSDAVNNEAEFKEGDVVFAKWAEDQVWYNAKVLGVNSDLLEVEFVDYGNTDTVLLLNVVKNVQDIPKADDCDENIKGIDTEVQKNEESKKVDQVNSPPIEATKENSSAQAKDLSNDATHVAGNLLFAKWSEDGVWYNAKILHVHSDHLEVEFVDYGNTDKVTLLNVVKDFKGIPEADDYDINVKGMSVEEQNEEVEPTATGTKSVKEEAKPDEPAAAEAEPPKEEKVTSSIGSIQPKQPSKLEVGDSCVARWSEDSIWYNAKILSVTASGFNVNFVDYGNDADVTLGDIFSHDDSYKIPATETVDENVNPSVQPPMASSNIPTTEKKSMDNSSTSKPSSKPEEQLKKATQGASPKTNTKVENKATLATEKETNVNVGEVCFAKWAEDQHWYKAKVVEVSSLGAVTVEFTDYGNIDVVLEVVMKAQDIPKDSQIDDNVLSSMSPQTSSFTTPDKSSREDSGVGDSVLDQEKTSFLNFVADKEFGAALTARKRMVIKNLNGPTGVAVLDEDTIAVVSRNDQKVSLYSKTGNPLGQLSLDGRGKLSRPSDICALKTGEVLVRDGNGVHMWNKKKAYQGRLGEANYNKYFACGESDDHLITINSNLGSEVGPGTTTDKGMTDVFFFGKRSREIEQRIEMEDVIDKHTRVNSECSMTCRYVNYDHDRLFVVDMGLHYIYCIENKDGDWGATVLGGSGRGISQLQKPAGLVFDDHGNAMVVDSGNNRLQVLDTNLNFCGAVKVDRPLVRPSGIFMDRESSELYVSNFGDSSVVCYVLDKPES